MFLLYGADKLKSIRGSRRISERALLFCAVCFGGLGAFFGMLVFNHKTRKKRFKILVPFGAALTVLIFFVCFKR